MPIEWSIYQRFVGQKGIPITYFYTSDQHYNYLGMERCASSLDEAFKKNGSVLPQKQLAALCIQMIQRLETFHRAGFIHRDLKPHNFLLTKEITSPDTVVKLIDFGLAKSYLKDSGSHIRYRTDRKFMGTVKYAPINAHMGIEQSRRDDLESLGYVILYLMNKAQLPWQENKKLGKEQNRKWILQNKRRLSISELCNGMLPFLRGYFEYVSMLEFDEAPNYKYLRAIIRPYTRDRPKKI